MSPTLVPPVIAMPTPWISVMVPSVATSDGAEVFAMISPFNNPNTRLVQSATRTASATLAPPCVPNAHVPFNT